MGFDEILKELGEFGRFQKFYYFLFCLLGISPAFHMMLSVFVQPVVDYRCAIPSLSNDSYQVQGPAHALLINKSIPYKRGPSGAMVLDRCRLYKLNRSNILDSTTSTANNTETEKCASWVYDESIFTSTAVSTMNLVCDRAMMTSHIVMVYMSGVLVGSLALGSFADIIGRKTVLCLSIIIQVSAGIAASQALEFISFAVFRFFEGASSVGIFLSSFVMGMELVGPNKRLWVGIVIEYFFALGIVILAGIAYVVRDWRKLMLITSAPTAIFLTYWWIVPESPRWLSSRGNDERAEAIIRKMAKVNGVTLSDKVFEKTPAEEKAKTVAFWRIFTSPVLLVRTLVIYVNWMVVSMVYYGLSLNSGNLGGDLYLNFFLSGLVEFPAYTLCLLLLNRVGRKWLHCITMLTGGLACISTIFAVLYAGPASQWITITLAMVGKLGVTAAFAIIYVFSAELFPTVIRNTAMGSSSCFARVGGMICPYVVDLGKIMGGNFGRAFPLMVFGTASVVAGLLALILPETLNRQLPETIEDGEAFGRDDKMEKTGKKSKLEIPTLTEGVYHHNPGFSLQDETSY